MQKLALVKLTTEDLRVARRRNGKVFRVKDNSDRTVAELTIGKTTVRLNLKYPLTEMQELVAEAEGLLFNGKSSTWTGGGVHVTEANYEAVRQVLLEIVKGGGIAPRHVTSPREALEILDEVGVDLEQELKDLLQERLSHPDVKERLSKLQHVKIDLAA